VVCIGILGSGVDSGIAAAAVAALLAEASTVDASFKGA